MSAIISAIISAFIVGLLLDIFMIHLIGGWWLLMLVVIYSAFIVFILRLAKQR